MTLGSVKGSLPSKTYTEISTCSTQVRLSQLCHRMLYFLLLLGSENRRCSAHAYVLGELKQEDTEFQSSMAILQNYLKGRTDEREERLLFE